MSSTLRGRNLPLERSLAALADAMKRELPRHLLQMPGKNGPVHNIVAPAFLGNEPRLYTIDMLLSPDRRNYWFRFTRHVVEKPDLKEPRTPRLGVAGSGAAYLTRDKRWIRELLRMVRAHDRGQISSDTLAAHLASLNYEVHRGLPDESVGPSCIVAWRHRKEGVHKGGGGHWSFTGTTRDSGTPFLPTIVTGTDINAVIELMMLHVAKTFKSMRESGAPYELNKDEINAELARLPDKPDEKLR
jgi:hypothetical protein